MFSDALAFLKTVSPLRITVSGEIGSGKSTFAKHLAEDLEIPRTYIGGLMREEAARRGMTMDTFGTLLTTDDAVDRTMDELQRQKARETERGIFEGRTAWHFVEQPDVKLFFVVDPRHAAERLLADTAANRDRYHSVEEVLKANEERKGVENKRYHDYYGIDAYDRANFDLVIDTSNATIEEVYQSTVEKIADFLQKQAKA